MLNGVKDIRDNGTSTWSYLDDFKGKVNQGVQHLSFASGVEVVYVDLRVDSQVKHEILINDAPITFSFHLKGQAQGIISHSLLCRKVVKVRAGTTLLSYNPDSVCTIGMERGQQYRVLNVYIAPESLYTMLDEDLCGVPKKMWSALERREEIPCNFEKSISPQTRMILEQICSCPYQGTLKKLFLESKCVDLITRQLWEFGQPLKVGNTWFLSQEDQKKIRTARDILIANIASPPSFAELARNAGLNESKLKRGFKQVYQTTVFNFHREYRINLAKQLLDKGHVNVDETAHQLGFCDTTHFVKTFKNYFGTTPGTYLKTKHEQAYVLSQDTVYCLQNEQPLR